MTRLKLVLVKLVIALGAAAIVAWQWGAAMHKGNFGNESFNQGFIGQALLAAVMAGIPAILFAVLAYIALERLLFRRDELATFRAKRRLNAMFGNGTDAPQGPPASGREYAD